MTEYEQVMTLTTQLTLAEKVRLLEHLSISLRQDIEAEAYKHIAWEQFLDLTYGSLADDPLERPEQLPPDERDAIE